METANRYKELTNNKSLFYTYQYEQNHPVIMKKIENTIMEAVEKGLYITSLYLLGLSEYDIKMITKVLNKYDLANDWTVVSKASDSYQHMQLTIHWY